MNLQQVFFSLLPGPHPIFKVIKQGEPGTSFFVIAQSELEVFIKDAQGEEKRATNPERKNRTDLPFLLQSWKWKIAYLETKHIFQDPIFHFHDYGRKSRKSQEDIDICLKKIMERSILFKIWKMLSTLCILVSMNGLALYYIYIYHVNECSK